MIVRRSHRFEASRDATLASLASADYAALLAARHPFFAEVTVLSLRESATRVERRLRYRARPFIARLGPFSPDPAWFVWVEHSTLDRETGLLSFANVPVLESVRDAFTCRGSMHFDEQRGPTGAPTTVREARFELGFCVPSAYRPLARLALGLVQRQLAHSLDDEARLLSTWLGVTPGLRLSA
ncbi:MAG: hypothetical protein ABW252_20390 [Polyangiales bacterium]